MGYLQDDADSGDEEAALAEALGEEGDIPEVMAQAQAKLWDCCVAWGTELSSLSASLRTLLRGRFRPLHLDLIDPERVSDMEALPSPEDPGFAAALQANREAAAASIAQFSDGEALATAAALLHQVEVMLVQPHAWCQRGQGTVGGRGRRALSVQDVAAALLAQPAWMYVV